MNQAERRRFLIEELLKEHPEARRQKISSNIREQQLMLRGLMNVRQPAPVPEKLQQVQDDYLAVRLEERGVTTLEEITSGKAGKGGKAKTAFASNIPGVYVWQGDITTLKVDAIVNAANAQMMGCFVPGHHCIDNAIHTYAGMQLRWECALQMIEQGYEEPTGSARITPGFNLPAKHILHTVGPIVSGHTPTAEDERLLASCYTSCLDLAWEWELESVAFCCISTGVFGYPNEAAAKVAIAAVKEWLDAHEQANPGAAQGKCAAQAADQSNPGAAQDGISGFVHKQAAMTVVFNTFTDRDQEIYTKLLRP